jgi:hypothetical protein
MSAATVSLIAGAASQGERRPGTGLFRPLVAGFEFSQWRHSRLNTWPPAGRKRRPSHPGSFLLPSVSMAGGSLVRIGRGLGRVRAREGVPGGDGGRKPVEGFIFTRATPGAVQISGAVRSRTGGPAAHKFADVSEFIFLDPGGLPAVGPWLSRSQALVIVEGRCQLRKSADVPELMGWLSDCN